MTSEDDVCAPNLRGMVAVIAAEGGVALAELVGVLATAGMQLAVVSPDKVTVTAAVDAATSAGMAVIGVTADPTETAVWSRVAPHAEQRLGPIDAVIAAGSASLRDLVAATFATDMAARGHGAIVELDTAVKDRAVALGIRRLAADVRLDFEQCQQIAEFIAGPGSV